MAQFVICFQFLVLCPINQVKYGTELIVDIFMIICLDNFISRQFYILTILYLSFIFAIWLFGEMVLVLEPEPQLLGSCVWELDAPQSGRTGITHDMEWTIIWLQNVINVLNWTAGFYICDLYIMHISALYIYLLIHTRKKEETNFSRTEKSFRMSDFSICLSSGSHQQMICFFVCIPYFIYTRIFRL